MRSETKPPWDILSSKCLPWVLPSPLPWGRQVSCGERESCLSFPTSTRCRPSRSLEALYLDLCGCPPPHPPGSLYLLHAQMQHPMSHPPLPGVVVEMSPHSVHRASPDCRRSLFLQVNRWLVQSFGNLSWTAQQLWSNARMLLWLVSHFVVSVRHSPWSPWYGVVAFISFIMDSFFFGFWMCVLKGRSTYINMHLFCHLSPGSRCINIDFEDNALHGHNLYESKQKKPVSLAGKNH